MAMTNGKCMCNEGFLQRAGKDRVTRESVPEIRAPLVHDCEYIQQRNRLISLAWSMAGREHYSGETYSAAFIRHMDELWARRKEGVLEVGDV